MALDIRLDAGVHSVALRVSPSGRSRPSSAGDHSFDNSWVIFVILVAAIMVTNRPLVNVKPRLRDVRAEFS